MLWNKQVAVLYPARLRSFISGPFAQDFRPLAPMESADPRLI